MFCVSNRGLELNPSMTNFEITYVTPDATLTATMEGTVKMFSTDWTMAGFIEITMSMSYKVFPI